MPLQISHILLYQNDPKTGRNDQRGVVPENLVEISRDLIKSARGYGGGGSAGVDPRGKRGTGARLRSYQNGQGTPPLIFLVVPRFEEASRAPSCAALSFASMPRSARGTGDALQPLHLWTGLARLHPVPAREPRLCDGLLSEASVVASVVVVPAALRADRA